MAIARQSVGVLRSNPALMAFPVVSGIVSFFVSLTFFVPTFYFYYSHGQAPEKISPLGYAIMAIYYLVSYFVVIFFNVGLASCTYASMRGEKPTFGDGVRFSVERIGPIMGWTVVSATVGMVLQMIAERVGIIGKIVVAILGGAWNVITFLVIPVLAVEQKGPFSSVKESAQLLKKTWGEQIIGNGGIGLVFTLAALVPIAPLVVAIVLQSVPLAIGIGVFAVIYWLGLAILSASVSGVYRTALYVYATTGAPPAGFEATSISDAFKPRPQGKIEQSIRNRF